MRTVLSSRLAPDWRALAFLFLGAALAALALRPGIPGAAAGVQGPGAAAEPSPAAAAGLSPAAAGTGWVSCTGLGFLPHNESARFGTFGTVHVFETVSFCPISLPHGATITAMRMHLYDNDASGKVGPCYLRRIPLDAADFDSPQVVAGPLETGESATPGYAVSTDSIIPARRATVDNRSFAYNVSCGVSDYDPQLGVVGVSVRYTTAS